MGECFTPKEMKAAEEYFFNECKVSSLSLMKNAAYEMSQKILSVLDGRKNALVLCGKGNNAGDGYELSRLLNKYGVKTLCLMALDEPPKTKDAQFCYNEYVGCGGKTAKATDLILSEQWEFDVIIDAVFGIGFEGVIQKDSLLYSLIEKANNTRALKIAIDIPSGVNGFDGSVGNIAFCADITLTVAREKIGMLSYPAKDFCGAICVLDIGIPQNILRAFSKEALVPDKDYIERVLPKRKENSNKGDYGKLLCVCGSKEMTGAAALCVGAALRAGTGLVTLASEESVMDCVKHRYLEPVYIPIDFEDDSLQETLSQRLAEYSAILIGCGLGKSEKKKSLVEYIVKNAPCRLIIDADGINMLADNINVLREAKAPVIITPHPREFSRISCKDTDFINSNRISTALTFAKEYNCIVVLKGARTVIASYDSRYCVNTSGNAGLAKGGSGDVLSGLISGLAANNNISAFDAAVSGVYLHGCAADILKKKSSEYGMLPSELEKELAKILP